MTRSPISPAALLVKVTARMESGATFFSLDQPGDAVGDDAGFARSGAGQDEQRAFGGFNGGALFGIQIGEERMQRRRVLRDRSGFRDTLINRCRSWIQFIVSEIACAKSTQRAIAMASRL